MLILKTNIVVKNTYTIHTQDSLRIEARKYVTKISEQKVTVDSISIFLNNQGANNFNKNSILGTLMEMQAKDLINKFNRPVRCNIKNS